MVGMVKKLKVVPRPKINAANLGARFKLIKKIVGVTMGGMALCSSEARKISDSMERVVPNRKTRSGKASIL